MIPLAVIVLLIAALTALLTLRNLAIFLPPPRLVEFVGRAWDAAPSVSVLIPARNEAACIAASVGAALQSEDVNVEVVVLNDDSEDATPEIVMAMAQRDTRVRMINGRPLPAGWNGKQHACWQLAAAASHPYLVFLDADVRLSKDAVARLVLRLRDTNLHLVSAFPHQETETFWERLLIPLMHYILLGFLPIARMRASRDPAFAAGCGQCFVTDQESYQRAGTHEAIKQSRHDGVKLPRAYRSQGLGTDVYDGTELASCRMYHSAQEVFNGLLKNAVEGIAAPKLIVPFSLLLFAANVLPLLILLYAFVQFDFVLICVSLAATIVGWWPRWACALRFSQSYLGAALQPLAIAVFLTIQWLALVNHLRGKKVAWRGRTAS